MFKFKTSWQKKVLKSAAAVHRCGRPHHMKRLVFLGFAVMLASAACSTSKESFLTGPTGTTVTTPTTNPAPRSDSDEQGSGWLAFNSTGARWPSPMGPDRIGTAQSRNPQSTEQLELRIPPGEYVHSGAGICFEVRGLTLYPDGGADLGSYHVTLRYSDPDGGDFFERIVQTDPVTPCFFMEQRGFWTVAAWQADGRHAQLGDYAY